MRTDEAGNSCPETLGEYRDLCDAIGVEGNEAVKLLDDKIAASPNGRDEKVIAADSQMRGPADAQAWKKLEILSPQNQRAFRRLEHGTNNQTEIRFNRGSDHERNIHHTLRQ